MIKEMNYFEEYKAIFDLEVLSKKEQVTIDHPKTKIEKAQLHAIASLPNDEDQGLQNLPSNKKKYYYSASEVGRDIDTLQYLTDEKNISEIHQAFYFKLPHLF